MPEQNLCVTPLCGECGRFRECRQETDAVFQAKACWEFIPAGFFGQEQE